MGRPLPPEFREEAVRIVAFIEVCEDGERLVGPSSCMLFDPHAGLPTSVATSNSRTTLARSCGTASRPYKIPTSAQFSVSVSILLIVPVVPYAQFKW